MELKLIQLTDRKEILSTYNIYKFCMYMPTEEKFNKKIDTFLNDDSIKIFACLYQEKIKGVIVISFLERYKIEIIGIAVEKSDRNKGIGTYMINKIVNEYGLISVLAETDDDAIDFYRRSGFGITECIKNYDGETVIRYRCELVKCKEADYAVQSSRF